MDISAGANNKPADAVESGMKENEWKRDLDHEADTETDTDSDDKIVQKVRGLKHSTCLQPTDPEYAAT